MVDDGAGNGIRIPSILIGHQDGEYIKEFMENPDDDDRHTSPKVSLLANFGIDHPDNRVEWDFWYSSSSTKSYEFLKGYRELHEKLGDKTLFTPHFSFWECKECDATVKRNDCFNDGKYCGVNDDKDRTHLSGQDILYENLRQKCLYNLLTESGKTHLWWDYVLRAHSVCYNGIDTDCSEQTHDKLGLDFDETQRCVDDSFYKANRESSENDILRDELEYMRKYGPQYFPAAVINNITYRGVLEPENFFDAVCAGFKDKPSQCSTERTFTTIIEGINTSTLLLIIFALVIINVGIIVCYKRYAKKEMDEKIEMHINSAVSQYFALQDKGNKSSRPLIH